MASIKVRIHHLGFARSEDYGRQVITIEDRHFSKPPKETVQYAEVAFILTNHPEPPEFSQVIEVDGCYSTSVGDVVEVDEHYFVCGPFGWKEITGRDFRLLVAQWGEALRNGDDVRGWWEDQSKNRYSIRKAGAENDLTYGLGGNDGKPEREGFFAHGATGLSLHTTTFYQSKENALIRAETLGAEWVEDAYGERTYLKGFPKTPKDKLRYHVTGAIERGEKEPIVEIPA